jgi:hypothetical protein
VSQPVRRLAVSALWLLAVMAMAMVGGSLAMPACLWNMEMISVGPIAALSVLPSVLLYWFLEWRWPNSRAKHFGFVLPLVPVVGFMAANFLYLETTSDPEGARGMVSAIIIAIFGSVIGAVVGLIIADHRSKTHPQEPFRIKPQFNITFLFVVTTLCAILFASCRFRGFELGFSVFGGLILLLLAMIVVQGTDPRPDRGWKAALLFALTAIYVPFLVLVVAVWLSPNLAYFRTESLEYLFILPGGMVWEFATMRIFHRHVGATVLQFVVSALSTVAIIYGTTQLARGIPIVRWIGLSLVAFFSVFGAMGLYAMLSA